MAYESVSFREHNEVRLPLLSALVDLGWSRQQIVCPSPDTNEREWRIPKNPSAQAARERGRSFDSYPCDLIVFDSIEGYKDPEHALVIAECKLAGDTGGITELETYLTLEPRARLGILFDGVTVTRTYKLADGTFKHEVNAALPKPGENLMVSDRSIVWNDLHVPTEEELRATFSHLLNAIVSSDGSSTRSDDRLNEICNMLLLKLDSDGMASRAVVREPQRPVRFQIGDNPKATADAINAAFDRYRGRHHALFDRNEPHHIQLDDETIHAIVYELQAMNMVEVSAAALSYAFQVFRNANLKVGEGQYFTPLRVIEAGTMMMGIDDTDRVIDPACGTGGFLSQAFLTVREQVGEAAASRWASHNLFGVDLDDINAKLVRALMVGIGDGSTNAYVGDSLRERKWVGDMHGIQDALFDGSYTVVLTNPPFGKNLRLSAADARASQYTVCDRSILGNTSKGYEATELGIVFVERAWRLLEEGGRLGIVLPETYFFSKAYEWFRKWVDQHFYLCGVLNIPMEAFQGFCRAKTNFYVFEKRSSREVVPHSVWFVGDHVWVSNAPTIGINKDGEELYVLDDQTHQRTNVIDNKALEDVMALVSGHDGTPTSGFVAREGVSKSLVGVPRYSDYSAVRSFERWVSACLDGCVPVTLGQLVDDGQIVVRGGHGSPSSDMRAGTIPYIKVSDLRNGLVNPNSSNMVSEQVACRYWRAESSGLAPYSIITPARASKNIGEPVMLLPGQERSVLTKEVLVICATESACFDNFYIMWALSNEHVLAQWSRVVFMQTNREDLGNRWREIEVPLPSSREMADALAAPYRSYYTGLAELRECLANDLAAQGT